MSCLSNKVQAKPRRGGGRGG
ncbi:hypothetical protein YPPY64_4489, partial [Yersinia pestis PY-64]